MEIFKSKFSQNTTNLFSIIDVALEVLLVAGYVYGTFMLTYLRVTFLLRHCRLK